MGEVEKLGGEEAWNVLALGRLRVLGGMGMLLTSCQLCPAISPECTYNVGGLDAETEGLRSFCDMLWTAAGVLEAGSNKISSVCRSFCAVPDRCIQSNVCAPVFKIESGSFQDSERGSLCSFYDSVDGVTSAITCSAETSGTWRWHGSYSTTLRKYHGSESARLD